MSEEQREKYRIVRGGQYAKRRKHKVPMSAPELLELDRAMVESIAAWEGTNGTAQISDGVDDIRRWRQRSWRVFGRRFLEGRAAHVRLAQALDTVYALEKWVRKLYQGSGLEDWAA